MPYSEMAGHCEALLVGKQQKMSALMSAQQNQESSVNIYAKEALPHSHVESVSLKVLTCAVATPNFHIQIKWLLWFFSKAIEILQRHPSSLTWVIFI